MCCFPSTPTLSPAPPPLFPTPFFCFCFIAVRTLRLNLSARCLSWFIGRFNRPTPSDSTPSSHLWCIPTQCAALPLLSGLSPLRSPLLHNPGVHAGALGFNPMLLPKLDRREIPRFRDRGNSYRSNPDSPSIRGSGSCLRLCRVVFACYTPTGGSRPTPAGAGQGGSVRVCISLYVLVRPIKCQSRLWSQSGTKVNGSHHGDNPLLRPTGTQIATKSYAALQAMAPTNIKTVHQTSLLHIESNLDRLGMLSPTHDQRPQQKTWKITIQPVLINKSKLLKATHCTEIRKLKYRGPWWWRP